MEFLPAAFFLITKKSYPQKITVSTFNQHKKKGYPRFFQPKIIFKIPLVVRIFENKTPVVHKVTAPYY